MSSTHTEASPTTPNADGIVRDEGRVNRRSTPGPALYFCATVPSVPRAAIALVHGYADYGARYAHVANFWAERGLATIALDLRGHGRADGPRGYCDRFTDYLDDVAELMTLVRDRLPGVPLFLFGHSFGGLVATAQALASPQPWRALVLTGPNFGIAVKVPWIERAMARVMAGLVPNFGRPSGLCGADLTHDAARARAYDADPLVFKNAKARWFTETLAAQARVMAAAGSLALPVYLSIGSADRVSDVGTARAFYDAVKVPDKTWVSPPGLLHEILNEPQWADIAGPIAEWVLARAT